ncbi:helix-turn-helix domain-containing protein [Epilithonimonas hominis]|uniref:AraC family transcriptional regulator n=1 Tax=Epilithonimonas hominis TaxID=420404 RepID=A0A3N0X7T7_9FLAO|nr:helix-turn-helix domain-containing protein [Epilithonimonas hominis]ROI13390.1 AraC family transcriptional regulator [Epilithonimonas hominis]
MNLNHFQLNKPNLTQENKLNTLVENQTKFSLNNCEFSIYETHHSAYNVKLHFEHLAFTGMLRGKKWMKLQNKSNYFEYLPGESVLVAPGETMVIDFPDADKDASQCISLTLNPEFVQESLDLLNFNAKKVDDSSQWNISLEEFYLLNSKALASATNNIMRIAMDDNSYKDVIADFALKELLIRLMQTQARNLVEKNTLKNKSRIGFVADYIKKNLHQKLSIDVIAKMAYVSKSNFFKMFKEELGISPNEFIIQERIKRAKEMLMHNNSVNEVAFSTGFSDTNYFIRVFKQMEGVTPKIFQNKKLI